MSFLRRLRIEPVAAQDGAERPLHPDAVQPRRNGNGRIAGPAGGARRSAPLLRRTLLPSAAIGGGAAADRQPICSTFRRRFGNSRANGCICARADRTQLTSAARGWQQSTRCIGDCRPAGVGHREQVSCSTRCVEVRGVPQVHARRIGVRVARPDCALLRRSGVRFRPAARSRSRDEVPRCQVKTKRRHATGLEHMAVQRARHS